MKRTLLAITAFAVILSSCQKEADVNGNANKGGNNSMSFKASILSAKTTLSQNEVYWSENDTVSINGEIFKATSSGSTTTVFTKDSVKLYPPFNAIYPCSLINGKNYELPATQKYSGSKVDYLPMYATSNIITLTFQNLCGVLGVKVKSSDMESVKSIKVSCSNTDMYGAFTVSDGKAVLSSKTGSKKSVVLECSEAISTAKAGTIFYIALPEADYENLKKDYIKRRR